MSRAIVAITAAAALAACGPTVERLPPIRPSIDATPAPDAKPDPRADRLEEARLDADLARRAGTLEALAKDAPPSDRIARQARMLLVRTYAQMGKLAEMHRAAGELEIPDDSEGADILNVMAYAYANAGTNLDRALAYARRAVEVVLMLQRPETVPAEVWERQIASVTAAYRDTLGWVLFKGGDHAGAVRQLTHAAEVLPDDPTVTWHLGRALLAAKRPKDAVGALVRSAVAEGDESAESRTLAFEAAEKAGIPAGDVEKRLLDARADLERRVRMSALARRVTEAAREPVAVKDAEGNEVRVPPADGRPSVLLFWGSYSDPSVKALRRTQSAVDPARTAFVALALDRDAAAAAARAGDAGLVVPTALDADGKVARAFQVRGLPTLLVLDAQGRVRYRNEGIVPGYEIQLKAQLESLGDLSQ